MKIYDPREYASTLKRHLSMRESMDGANAELTIEIEALEEIENEIFEISRKYEELKHRITQLDKEYQVYNIRYGLGEDYPDHVNNKKLRSETWEKIYKCGEEKENTLKKLKVLRIDRDVLSQKVGYFRRQYKATREFFELHEGKVNLYSIVKLEYMGSSPKFILLTDLQRQDIWFQDLDSYSIDSPLGRSCLGKAVGDAIICETPSGQKVEGKVVGCELPTIDIMDELISKMNRALVIGPSPKVDLNSWTSNNTRYRKGG